MWDRRAPSPTRSVPLPRSAISSSCSPCILAAILVGVEGYRRSPWPTTGAGIRIRRRHAIRARFVDCVDPGGVAGRNVGHDGDWRLRTLASESDRFTLSAIEELAGVDILCSNKTGTLTHESAYSSDPASHSDSAKADDVLRDATLATQKSSQDAIDVAILKATDGRADLQRGKANCFRSLRSGQQTDDRKRGGPGGKVRHYAKGAPQAIASLAKPDGGLLDRYTATVSDLASKGYRALGVARSADGRAWEIVGIVSLMDPPRADAKTTIAEAKALGLNVKMVTGDDVAIGDQIAAQLDLGDHLLVASDVFGDGDGKTAPSSAVMDAVERADGFARVFPAAQVRDRQDPAKPRPHRRNDGRRSQ